MTPLPTELITLFSSSAMSGLFKLWSMNLKVRRDERLATLLALQNKNQPINTKVLSPKSKNFQWTRRLIAYTAVLFIIVFPKLAAVYVPDLNIHIGYPQVSKGFLWFTSDVERITWVHLQGLVITPLDTHLLSAIIGLYFGGSIVNNN